MPGMREAVERIQKAVDRDEAIVVYGDYDVDGVCASAILHGQLRAMGARCEVYLPSRHTEGYGLNEAAVRGSIPCSLPWTAASAPRNSLRWPSRWVWTWW